MVPAAPDRHGRPESATEHANPVSDQPKDPATEEARPPAVKAGVEYKGAPLDAEKGPGLGCFWLQIVVLAVTMFLAPLSAAWNWPVPIVIFLFALVIVLLLFVGQTIIFLLRLVAADRRAVGRRRPMDSATKTVGEIEDEGATGEAGPDAAASPGASDAADEPGAGGVRE